MSAPPARDPKLRLRMPDVLCEGHAVITVVDALNDEVRVAIGGHLTYMKRDRRESYDDFVRRVTRFCEDQYARRSR
jgi:hypothetical protein